MARKLVALAVVTAVMALGIATTAPADAAPRGKPSSSATLTVSPDVAPAWGGQYTITGSGFEPDTGIQLGQSIAGGCCSTFMVRADATGSFTMTGYTEAPGPYVFTASILTRKGWRAVASDTLIVE